jgi:hypothetical protein
VELGSINGPTIRKALSARVHQLLSRAIALAAARKLGVHLSELLANQLAEFGDLEEALRRLKERLPFRRSANGIALPYDSQIRLAVAEVVAKDRIGPGDPKAHRDFIRTIVEAERDYVLRERDQEKKIQLARDLPRAIHGGSVALRAFFRQASRLRTLQVNRLNASVLNSSALASAVRGLDEVYARYIDAATNVADATNDN